VRTLLAAVLAVSLSAFAGARDEKPSVADQVKALQKKFQEDQQPLAKKFQETKDEKEKAQIRTEALAMQAKLATQIYTLAKDNLKDDGAFDAAFLALRMGEAKAADLIASNFADNAKLTPMVPQLAQMGPGGEKLLSAIAEKATDKKAKGTALYFLAAGKLESADYPRTGEPLPADKQAAAFKEAEATLKTVAKDFGDVEVQVGRKTETIAKAAEGQLFFLNNLTVGKKLPDSEVEGLDGKKVKISDYKGKVVVLDIWATWCGPCRAMIPHERELTTRLKDKPFAFISLSADAKKETLTAFIEKEPMPWVHWWNGGAQGGAIEAYKVRFYPTVYVLDDKGVIRFKHVRGEKMDKAVDALLKEVKTNG
jgi:thiol-disulfide isomerase/thioredoxin